MCGIIGAVADEDVVAFLLAGLKRLEYRGYDSAGIAILDQSGALQRVRTVGKIKDLEVALQKKPLSGKLGIAHTRWATHGEPCQKNAHPHIAGDIAIIHNGILENHESLRKELLDAGASLQSETDSELVAHLIFQQMEIGNDLLTAVRTVIQTLTGNYAIAVIHAGEKNRMIAFSNRSPLIVGIGQHKNFIASDMMALLPNTHDFIVMADDEIADISADKVHVYDLQGKQIKREIYHVKAKAQIISKSNYPHYMLKEIFEQPQAVSDTMHQSIDLFAKKTNPILKQVKHIHLVACGTSYHAGLVAGYWLEALAGIACKVEIASEYRYRQKVIPPDTLFIALSQSGETADTLAALRLAKELPYLSTLAICNSANSTMMREADLHFHTQAGIEIGVASTKAFTTQLTALFLLTLAFSKQVSNEILNDFQQLPNLIEDTLSLNDEIKKISRDFIDKHNSLFIARHILYPIAEEGALKLKEISYIHAEAYAAGELKHGPLALVDHNMPVIALAPHDFLEEKLKSNLEEISARHGLLYLFADPQIKLNSNHLTRIDLPRIHPILSPFTYVIPLQLLSYHVAALKGTDIDQPRNLAKSVTVE